jgi:protein-tyrosine phosphatase
MGNICRSPTAEGVFRRLVRDEGLGEDIEIDSAGTGDWHVGEPPDSRSAEAALRRGIDLEGSARQFARADFERFDLILAMDERNRDALLELAPDDDARAKVRLFREFDPASNGGGDLDVPDPYFGGEQGFEHVLDLVDAAARGLLDDIRAR